MFEKIEVYSFPGHSIIEIFSVTIAGDDYKQVKAHKFPDVSKVETVCICCVDPYNFSYICCSITIITRKTIAVVAITLYKITQK